MLLSIQFPFPFFIFPAIIILSREIFISALREWMAKKGVADKVKVGLTGKFKTAFQMISLALLLCVYPGQKDICNQFNLPKNMIFIFGIAQFYLASILSMLSGYQYFISAWPHLINN